MYKDTNRWAINSREIDMIQSPIIRISIIGYPFFLNILEKNVVENETQTDKTNHDEFYVERNHDWLWKMHF